VTATCGRILAGKGQDGCIILEAAPDATLAAANITVYGTGTVPAPVGVPASAGTAPPEGGAQAETTPPEGGTPTVPLRIAAQNFQETYMPGGGRAHWPVPMHTVAVGKPGDIRAVKLSSYEIALKPGESVKIDVEIERGGYDKNVTLDLLFQHLSSVFANTLPEGVTIDALHAHGRGERGAGREAAVLRDGERVDQLRDEIDVEQPAADGDGCEAMSGTRQSFTTQSITSL
jgi:hypothetical protein